MDINIIKFFFSLPICMVGIMHLLLPDQLNGFETKRFDAPPPKRTTYLKFAPPKSLRYAPAKLKLTAGTFLSFLIQAPIRSNPPSPMLMRHNQPHLFR